MALPGLINEVMSGDQAVILRKLVQLRLFVLSTALVILAMLHLNSRWPLNYPVVAGIILIGIIWSLWLLRRTRTPASGSVIPRELLLDALWLVLVVLGLSLLRMLLLLLQLQLTIVRGQLQLQLMIL